MGGGGGGTPAIIITIMGTITTRGGGGLLNRGARIKILEIRGYSMEGKPPKRGRGHFYHNINC